MVLPRRWCLPAALLALGCGAPAPTSDGVEDEAADEIEGAYTEAALLVAAADGLAIPPTPLALRPAVAAAFAARRAEVLFRPSSCVTASSAGPAATYTLDGCHGPGNVSGVSGAVTVTFSTAGDGTLRATARSAGLVAEGARVDLDADVTLGVGSGAVTATVTSRTAIVGPRGSTLQRDGGFSVTWTVATQCVSFDGEWRTSSRRGEATTRARDIVRCMGRCPQAGGSVSYALAGETVTLTFTGGRTARWSSTTSGAGTLALLCQP
ncbi:MAG: hypothetical protein R3A52_24590 [Polyangiales bacterium]